MSLLRLVRSEPCFRGWTAAEQAEIQQTRFLIEDVYGSLGLEFGETDQGDPWAAFEQVSDGVVVAHFTRTRDKVLVDLPALDILCQGRTLREVLYRVVAECRTVPELTHLRKSLSRIFKGNQWPMMGLWAAVLFAAWEMLRLAPQTESQTVASNSTSEAASGSDAAPSSLEDFANAVLRLVAGIAIDQITGPFRPKSDAGSNARDRAPARDDTGDPEIGPDGGGRSPGAPDGSLAPPGSEGAGGGAGADRAGASSENELSAVESLPPDENAFELIASSGANLSFLLRVRGERSHPSTVDHANWEGMDRGDLAHLVRLSHVEDIGAHIDVDTLLQRFWLGVFLESDAADDHPVVAGLAQRALTSGEGVDHPIFAVITRFIVEEGYLDGLADKGALGTILESYVIGDDPGGLIDEKGHEANPLVAVDTDRARETVDISETDKVEAPYADKIDVETLESFVWKSAVRDVIVDTVSPEEPLEDLFDFAIDSWRDKAPDVDRDDAPMLLTWAFTGEVVPPEEGWRDIHPAEIEAARGDEFADLFQDAWEFYFNA